MCLIAFASDVGENVLVLAANRDEAYARRTAPAAAWSGAPQVFGGRDLEAGGTWLAFSTAGRLAAVTNVRTWPPARGGRSRGALCGDFVTGDASAAAYGATVVAERAHYAEFNLLVHDGHSFQYINGAGGPPVAIAPGIHGLSNALLDVPWPKVTRATAALRAAIEGPADALVSDLFGMLADRRGASDEDLPNTGIPAQLERDLAPIFIASSVYGTRSSTVVVWRRDGRVSFEERSFGNDGVALGVVRTELLV
jgi:uncharacterized protein with NRDE domain